MKGKAIARRSTSLIDSSSQLASDHSMLQKYSQSFMQLMQKAIFQLKNQQKSSRKHSNLEKLQPSYDYSMLTISQKKNNNIRNQFYTRRQLDTIQPDFPSPKKSIAQYEVIKTEPENAKREQSPIYGLNTFRMKATFNIKARKCIKAEKIRFSNRMVSPERKSYVQPRKAPLYSDNFIQPWVIREDFDF